MSEKNQESQSRKLSNESAETQLKMLLDYYDMETEDIDAINKRLYKELIKPIVKGRVEIKKEEDNTVSVTQTIKTPFKSGPSVLKYGVINGDAKIAMKDDDGENNYSRTYTLMGVLCGEGFDVVKKLTGVDLSVVESYGAFFLAV